MEPLDLRLIPADVSKLPDITVHAEDWKTTELVAAWLHHAEPKQCCHLSMVNLPAVAVRPICLARGLNVILAPRNSDQQFQLVYECLAVAAAGTKEFRNSSDSCLCAASRCFYSQL